MAQTSSKATTYVQNAAGVWTPVGYGSTNAAMPAALSSPNALPAGYFATVTPVGTQRVSVEPTAMFSDSFDTGALDANKWAVAATGGTTVTASAGYVQIPPAANAGTPSFVMRMNSVPAFAVPGTGYLLFQANIQVDSAAVANTYRYFGYALDAASPQYQAANAATSLAVSDAIGFELDGTGVLSAVVYVNTQAAFRQTISTSLWADGNFHRYYILRSGSQLFWFVDSLETPVAVRNVTIPGLYVDTLPLRFLSYNNSVAPVANFLRVTHVAVSDTTAQNHTISDPNYQFRRAAVTSSNHLKTQTASTLVTNSSPSVTTAAATVLAANGSRVGATIFNDASSASPVYLALGLTATTTAYAVLVAVGGYYEVPYGFSGVITGICATGTATLRVNELS